MKRKTIVFFTLIIVFIFVGFNYLAYIGREAYSEKHNEFIPRYVMDSGLQEELKQQRYFPPSIFSEIEDFHNFQDAWFGMHLYSMKEKSLWKKRKQERIQIYRILSLPSFSSPFCLTIEIKQDEAGLMHIKSTDGLGGYDPGKISMDQEFPLTKAEIEDFLNYIEQLRFWSLQVTDDPFALVVDGTIIVMEGLKDGQYHVVNRHSSNEEIFAKIDGLLHRLAGWRGIDLGGEERGEKGTKVPVTSAPR